MKPILDKDNSTKRWHCPHCGKLESSVIINEAVLKTDFEEILCGCEYCGGVYIRQYRYVKTIKLNREEVAHRE